MQIKILTARLDNIYYDDPRRPGFLLDHIQDQRELRQFSARTLNSVADIAKLKGCKDLAREAYLGVIDTYTGAAYASMRQRAQIGLDDLRANKN